MKPNEQIFIGIAKSGDLALSNNPYEWGSVIRMPGAAAACAVRPIEGGAYQILAFRTIPHDGVDVALQDLRRELAQLVTAKAERVIVGGEPIMFPEYDPPTGTADNSEAWREAHDARKAAEQAAAKARDAALDQVGAGFAVKGDGDVNLPRLWNLQKAGKILAANSNERAPLFWLRAAFENQQSIGVYGVALARAIAAADAGAQRGAARR